MDWWIGDVVSGYGDGNMVSEHKRIYTWMDEIVVGWSCEAYDGMGRKISRSHVKVQDKIEMVSEVAIP